MVALLALVYPPRMRWTLEDHPLLGEFLVGVSERDLGEEVDLSPPSSGRGYWTASVRASGWAPLECGLKRHGSPHDLSLKDVLILVPADFHLWAYERTMETMLECVAGAREALASEPWRGGLSRARYALQIAERLSEGLDAAVYDSPTLYEMRRLTTAGVSA